MALAQLRNAPQHDYYRTRSHQFYMSGSCGSHFNLALSSLTIQLSTSGCSYLPAHTTSRTWLINSLHPLRPIPTTSIAGKDADAPLQPKPQLKRPRLPTLSTPTGAPPKPRRWHQNTSTLAPLPSQSSDPPQLQHQLQQPSLNDPLPQSSSQQMHHAPALAFSPGPQIASRDPADPIASPPGSTRSPNAGRGGSRGRAGGRGRGRESGESRLSGELVRHYSPADDRQLHGRPQPKAQSRTQPRPGASARKTQAGRGGPAAPRHGSTHVYGNEGNEEDADDENEDEDGELLLGMSEEEIERMVFARAGGGELASSSDRGVNGGNDFGIGDSSQDGISISGSTSSKKQRHRGQQPNGTSSESVTAPAAAATTADIITAAGIPPTLSAQILAAVQSGVIPNDPHQLAAQLKALREGAADLAGTTVSTNATEAAVEVHNVDDVLSAAVGGISELLNCGEGVAVAILVNHPRYVRLPKEEAEVRLRFVSYQLGLDLVEALEVIRRNPVLLLVPSDALRRKLTALANATGLKMTQAADMVTLYMFPGL